MSEGTLSRIVGALVAVLAQIIVAPNIAIFGVFPNFISAYVLALVVVCPERSCVLMAFICGLVFNLIGGGALGTMAFSLVLVAFLARYAMSFFSNDTLFMVLVILIVSLFCVELFYAIFMLAFGFDATFIEAFVYRALPCALYDSIAGLVAYPLVVRFCAPKLVSPNASHIG